MVYQTAPFSMALNNPKPSFQGHDILWRWLSHKRLNIRLLLQNGNRKPYSSFRTVPFPMTLSDLDWLSEIFNDTKLRAVSATAKLIVYETFQNDQHENFQRLSRIFLVWITQWFGEINVFYNLKAEKIVLTYRLMTAHLVHTVCVALVLCYSVT